MGKTKLDAIADRGYFSGPQIKACEDAGITAYVPKPMTSNSAAEGRFSKADFIYIQRDDEYQCPAGERLRWRQTTEEKGLRVHSYWSNACGNCALRAQCTTGKERRVRRWEHEEVLERLQALCDPARTAVVIVTRADSAALRIYTTTIPTDRRLPTLMHDPQYRVAIAWQNTAYNQPPHPSFASP